MKRISNPRELQPGDAVEHSLDGISYTVKRKLGDNIELAPEGGGEIVTLHCKDTSWSYFRREKPKKVYRMRPRSPKRAKQETAYLAANRGFLMCHRGQCLVAARMLGVSAPVDQVHHMAGREGALLNDERHWLAVSAIGHAWIRDHGNEARDQGWLYEINEWQKPSR